MEIPKDNNLIREQYEDRVCGQSCLAVIEGTSVKEVLDNWIKVLGEFKGYSPYRDTRKYLETKGYKTKLIRMDNLGVFNYNNFYLCRVQWLGEGEKQGKPYWGWGSWFEASNHTHYILIHKGEVFCNADGVFDYHKIQDYLDKDNGEITSVIEIKPKTNGGSFFSYQP